MERATLILRIVGICTALVGAMALPFPQTSPAALTQSRFVWIAMTGAFVRPGLVLILIGLGCLVLSALLPTGRE